MALKCPGAAVRLCWWCGPMAGFTPAVFLACRLPWKGLAGCVESWVVPSSRMQMSGADGT